MTPDRAGVLRVLPHGHPMVLVDRVENLVPGHTVEAVKAVSVSEACFAGLESSSPGPGWAYPHSLVVESFGQAALILWWYSIADDATIGLRENSTLPMLTVVRSCSFAGRAYPGDVLRHHVTLDHLSLRSAMVSGYTSVEGCIIAVFGELIAVAGTDSSIPVTA